MRSTDAIVIDRDLCTGCGACVRTCPSAAISLDGGKAKVTGRQSLHCGHCAAVCPVSAVKVTTLAPETIEFRSFGFEPRWMEYGKPDTAELARLIGSRRSCRRYKPDPVRDEVLDDLVKIGIMAPSGTNSQLWAFTIVPTRRDVEAFGRKVADFYRKLNAAAEKGWMRLALRLIGQRELEGYWRNHYRIVKRGLEEYDAGRRDVFFQGATAAIIVSSRPGASCAIEDDILATGNILLAAHSMGLGTCLIGFAAKAMASDTTIQQAIGIPVEEKVHAVIALGHPDEKFVRIVGRRAPPVRRFRA